MPDYQLGQFVGVVLNESDAQCVPCVNPGIRKDSVSLRELAATTGTPGEGRITNGENKGTGNEDQMSHRLCRPPGSRLRPNDLRLSCGPAV